MQKLHLNIDRCDVLEYCLSHSTVRRRMAIWDVPASYGQQTGFVGASLGRRFLYTLYQKLLRNTWTRHHSSHSQTWQSIVDLLCCSGLVQRSSTAGLSLFWELGKILMHCRRLTIKIYFSALLSLKRMILSLLPPLRWRVEIGWAALTAAHQMVTNERRRVSHIWE